MIIPDSPAEYAFVGSDRVIFCCYRHVGTLITLWHIMNKPCDVMTLEPDAGTECEVCERQVHACH